MVVYWMLFIVPALSALYEVERPGGGLGPGFLWALVFVFFVIAFREVGGDYYTYEILFNQISRMDFSRALTASEPGYAALNWMSNQLDLGLYGVNAACALIFLFGFARFCAPEARPLLMLAVAVPYLIIVVVVGYTRQGTAIGLELLALRALMQRKFFLFITWVALATTFHSTAAILLPLGYYATPRRSGWLGRIAAGTAVALAAFFAYDQLFRQHVEMLTTVYVKSNRYESSGALVRSLMGVAAAIVYFLNRRKWAVQWDDQAMWATFSIAAIAVAGLTQVSSTAADRMGLYLIPLQLIVFARLPVLSPAPANKISVIAGVLALYTTTLVVWLHFGQFASVLWLPYKSLIFFEVP